MSAQTATTQDSSTAEAASAVSLPRIVSIDITAYMTALLGAIEGAATPSPAAR